MMRTAKALRSQPRMFCRLDGTLRSAFPSHCTCVGKADPHSPTTAANGVAFCKTVPLKTRFSSEFYAEISPVSFR